MKFRRLQRLLAEFGIVWDARKGKGSHGAFVGLTLVSRRRQVFVLPRHQQTEVSAAYLNPLRRKFELTSGHGVPNERFE